MRLSSAVRTRRASNEASAASAVVSCSTGWFCWWYVVSRRVAPRRPHPVDRLAVDQGEIQEIALPRAGSYRAEVRQMSRKASWLDLLGLGRVPDHPQREPEDPGRGGVVQLGEGRLVAPARPLEQLGEVGGLRPSRLGAVVRQGAGGVHGADPSLSLAHLTDRQAFGIRTVSMT